MSLVFVQRRNTKPPNEPGIQAVKQHLPLVVSEYGRYGKNQSSGVVVGCGLLPLGRIPTSQGKAMQGNAPAVDMPLYPERSSETSFQTIRSVGRSRRDKKDSSRPSRPVPSCPAGVSFLRTGRAGFLLVLVLFLLFLQDDDDTMIGRMFVGYWCCDTRHIHQRFCCCCSVSQSLLSFWIGATQ